MISEGPLADEIVENENIEEIELEYICRKKLREDRLSNIKEELNSKYLSVVRKEQNIFLYLYNLLVPIGMSVINYYIFIDMTEYLDLKAYLMLSICFSGMAVSIISNCYLAPWKNILILYFQLDSIVPILISACIAFYSLMNFFTLTLWQSKAYVVTFPLWVIYFTGNLRVMLVYVKWKKWMVILYKLVVLGCGLVSFLIGFEYMMGKYKIFQGYFLYV